MTDIKLQLKPTPSGDIDCSDGALVISTYVQVRGSGEGVDSDFKCERLFSDWRLLWTTESSLIRASAVAAGGGVYVPPTEEGVAILGAR